MNTDQFFSGLLQLSVTFASISAIFGFFRIETVYSEIARCCDNFRNWVLFRFQHDDNEYLKSILNMNNEPNSWIDCDLIEHIKIYKEESWKDKNLLF